MNSKIYFTPNQVIEAEKRFKNDTFKIDVEHIRTIKGAKIGQTRYITFSCKYLQNGKWEYQPLKLVFKNMSCGMIKLPAERSYNKVVLTFRGSSIYEIQPTNQKKVIQEYGKAKKIIYKHFQRLVAEHLAKKDFVTKVTTIHSSVQNERTINAATGEKVPVDDAIIRVELPWDTPQNGDVPLDAKPKKLDIYDVTKELTLITNTAHRFELATVPTQIGDEVVNVPINWGNIQNCLKIGSTVSGVDNMDSICISTSGISLPSKVQGWLYVNPGSGSTSDPSEVFNGDTDFTSKAIQVITDELEKTSLNGDDDDDAQSVSSSTKDEFNEDQDLDDDVEKKEDVKEKKEEEKDVKEKEKEKKEDVKEVIVPPTAKATASKKKAAK